MAERALRPAVIWRKTCFGSQSVGGLRFVERILTVAVTLKKQGRDLIEFVAQALKAKWFGLPAPSLIQDRTWFLLRERLQKMS